MKKKTTLNFDFSEEDQETQIQTTMEQKPAPIIIVDNAEKSPEKIKSND